MLPICVVAQIKKTEESFPDFLMQPILNQTEESISLNWGEPCGHTIVEEGDYNRQVSWKRRSGGEEFSTMVTFPIKKGDEPAEFKKEASTEFQISKRNLKKQLDLKWNDKEVKNLVHINFGDKLFRWNAADNNFICNEERLTQSYRFSHEKKRLHMFRGAVGIVDAEAN